MQPEVDEIIQGLKPEVSFRWIVKAIIILALLYVVLNEYI